MKEEKKYLTGISICLGLIFISSFMPWFSYSGYKNFSDIPMFFTLTGWDGYLRLFDITVQNWQVVFCALAIGLLVLLKMLKIWDAHILFYAIPLITILFHLNASIYLAFFEGFNLSFKFGYFLMMGSFIAMAVIFNNYYRFFLENNTVENLSTNSVELS